MDDLLARARGTVQIRVRDLKPGDIVDCANYRYRSTPCWREFVRAVPSAIDGKVILVVQGDKGEPYHAKQGIGFSPFDLVTVQV